MGEGVRNEQVAVSRYVVMARSNPRVVTGMMLGVFLAFGVDTIIVVGALWYVGQIPGATAGAISAAVLGVFGLWILVRWVRLRRAARLDGENADRADSRDQRDPVAQLKRRYAEGEISDAEFERRLDTMFGADRRAESSAERSTPELNERERR